MAGGEDTVIDIQSTGLVYRNPAPHLRAAHTWHPSVARVGKELVVGFDIGQAVEALDYRTYVARSSDGGASWSPPVRMFEDPPGRRCTQTARIGALRDGSLMAFGALLYRDDPELGLVNAATFGYTPMDLITLHSRDGIRWEGPRIVRPSLVGPGFEICHRIIELSDGRLLAPTSTWKGWNGEAPSGMKAVALVSHDRGESWPEHLTVMDRYADGLTHFEQGMAELPDRRILAVAWVFHEKSGRSLPNHYVISDRSGRRFSEPRTLGLHGETAKLHCLRDGRVLLVCRRVDKSGLWALLGRVRGDEWETLEERALWQGASSGMKGERAASEEMSALRFGFPSMAEMEDGAVFLVFWCQEDCINNVRWMRLTVS
jgi:sialidase-1